MNRYVDSQIDWMFQNHELVKNMNNLLSLQNTQVLFDTPLPIKDLSGVGTKALTGIEVANINSRTGIERIFPNNDYMDQLNLASSLMAFYNSINVSLNKNLTGIQNRMSESLKQVYNKIEIQMETLGLAAKMEYINDVVEQWSGNLVSILSDDIEEDDAENIKETDSTIISEIVKGVGSTANAKSGDAIIIVSPINDKILKYLSENPEILYQIAPGTFEGVMAEVYSRLGYDVTKTQATRDGGKDIIIQKACELGDFIYYVDCKRYSPKNPVGLGMVKSMYGTIDADKVNGGIIATTSYFTRDARNFVLSHKLNYQLQMHDYMKIRNLLKTVTT